MALTKSGQPDLKGKDRIPLSIHVLIEEIDFLIM